MPRHTIFHRIIEQETARIIGITPDDEVGHTWRTSWRGAAGRAILGLTTVAPPIWRLVSYAPVLDTSGLRRITSYHYTYDGHILSAARTEASAAEMVDGTSAARLREQRGSDINPLPPDYLYLATLLQQAPTINNNPTSVNVG